MDDLQARKEICCRFAMLLSYPDAEVQAVTSDCQRLLHQYCPDSASQLQSFVDYLAATDLPRSEELFTATFDLQPLCHPYVGYQLCGENEKRAMFLMQMQQLYRRNNLSKGLNCRIIWGDVAFYRHQR